MKIIDKLRNLLKREVSSLEIVSINQLISIPTREDFHENQKIINLIDRYKSEYKKMLSQFRYLTSLDISSKDLTTNINANIELLLNIFMATDEVKQHTLDDKINYLINIRKLELYGTSISELKIEVIARLIALNEIYNERKTFISRNKKNALANEINNLSVAMLLIKNKKHAIEFEKKHYLETAIYMTDTIKETDEEKKVISKKRILLLNIGKNLFPENEIQIREDKEYILMDMAWVEKMIEMYVYNHKNEVEALKKQFEEISESDITYDNKEKLLSALINLEYKYLAFYKYGRNYLGAEDLVELYSLKFNILVLSEDGICEVFVDENSPDIELECYKRIIEREIESFIKGEGEIKDPKIIKIIINILKHGSQTLDSEQILKNKYLLNVILSMRSRKDLINLMINFKVRKKDCSNIDFCSEVFDFDDELPLETIYRLMLAQNTSEDGKLYEVFANDLYLARYPNGDNTNGYYDLPVGLKGINYCTEISIKELQSTFLMIVRMRKLMSNKYIICPSTLEYIKGGKVVFKDAHVRGLIFYEGLEIAPSDTENIEILERTENKITIYNKKSNEVITSDLNCHINQKWGNFNGAELIKFYPQRNFYIEKYNSYEYAQTSLEKGKNAIDARRNDKTQLFSRAYVDVSTKYGDFCLHIEEKNNDYGFGSYISLSLYHGHHDEIIDELNNVFNWPEYGIFRTKYMKRNDFYQWMLGFVDSMWSHPFRNIWRYGQTESKESASNSPIYSFSEYQGTGKRGTIFIDGALKLEDNIECIPDMFENLEVDEYEDIECSSKAYFGTPSEHVAILKYRHNDLIQIIYKEKNRKSGIFEKQSSENIKSLSTEEFTEDDFEKILGVLNTMSIDQDLKKFIIDEIETYISLHYKKISFFIRETSDIETFRVNLSCFLKSEEFDTLLVTIDNVNAKELVEMLIENIIKIFHIDINDLLGNFKIKKIGGSQELESTKKLFLDKKDN